MSPRWSAAQSAPVGTARTPGGRREAERAVALEARLPVSWSFRPVAWGELPVLRVIGAPDPRLVTPVPGNLMPQTLAESWPLSADPRPYEFNLGGEGLVSTGVVS